VDCHLALVWRAAPVGEHMLAILLSRTSLTREGSFRESFFLRKKFKTERI
jgi:hypothetical protein